MKNVTIDSLDSLSKILDLTADDTLAQGYDDLLDAEIIAHYDGDGELDAVEYDYVRLDAGTFRAACTVHPLLHNNRTDLHEIVDEVEVPYVVSGLQRYDTIYRVGDSETYLFVGESWIIAIDCDLSPEQGLLCDDFIQPYGDVMSEIYALTEITMTCHPCDEDKVHAWLLLEQTSWWINGDSSSASLSSLIVQPRVDLENNPE